MNTARHPNPRRAAATRLGALLWAAVLTLPLATPAAPSAPLARGAAVPALPLQDQHDKPVSLTASTRWLVFTAERPVNDWVSAVFRSEPAGVLDRLQAVYVADVSAMPAVVTRMFALPKMREWPFAVGLVREPAQVTQWEVVPRQAGAATVLRLDDGRVTEVLAVRHAAELRAALGLEPP